MMRIVFFDPPENRTSLLPLTYTRPIADLRIGIFKVSEKWCSYFDTKAYGYQTETYLSKCFSSIKTDEQTLWLNSTVLPNQSLANVLGEMKSNEALVDGKKLIGFKGKSQGDIKSRMQYKGNYTSIMFPWDIFRNNGQEIVSDYDIIKKNRKNFKVTDHFTTVYGDQVFVEEGASIKAAILNAENGPIYIGKNAIVMEGSIIRGPFALGDYGEVRMGAKIRGDTTIGPHCKVGGEVSNSVLFGHSNKAHDGYLGNSVIGEWCNLGAGTNNSNLKNTYEKVKMWNYATRKFEETGLQFCGLIMGDHTKAGINTMFNTGTTVGVAANIFGGDFQRKVIPSYSWGGARGFVTYGFQKAIRTIRTVVGRGGFDMNDDEEKVLQEIFEMTAPVRSWEKQEK